MSSVGAIFAPRAVVAHRSRGVAGLTGWLVGQQVAMLAACATRDGDQVLEGDEAGQADAYLVLGPSEGLAQLAASETDCARPDSAGFDVGRDAGLGSCQETSGLGSQIVAPSGEHPLGQAHPEGDIIVGCFDVADGAVSDFDGVLVTLVLMEQDRGTDEAE